MFVNFTFFQTQLSTHLLSYRFLTQTKVLALASDGQLLMIDLDSMSHEQYDVYFGSDRFFVLQSKGVLLIRYYQPVINYYKRCKYQRY